MEDTQEIFMKEAAFKLRFKHQLHPLTGHYVSSQARGEVRDSMGSIYSGHRSEGGIQAKRVFGDQSEECRAKFGAVPNLGELLTA